MNRMQRLLAFTAPALAAGAASAQEIGATGDALTQRGMRIVSIVAPDYPNAFLARGESGTLDLEARVRADGSIDPGTLKISGGDEAFSAEIRPVIRYWLFMPRIDPATCNATAGDLAMKVWFEVVDGKPKVSVSQPAALGANQSTLEGDSKMFRKKSGNAIAYPYAAQRDNVEGAVSVTAKIDRQGRISNVQVQPGLFKRWFEREILQALPHWDFEVLPGFPKDKDFVCTEFLTEFRLSDSSTESTGISDLRRRTRQN